MEQYFKFDGTATRSEYWGVYIIGNVLSFMVMLAGVLMLGTGSGLAIASGAILILAALVAAVWLTVATTVRRCRDAGINVWWTAAICIPYVGWIVSIILGCLKTDEATR